MPRRRLPARTLRLTGVPLMPVAADAELPNPDWIQIAAEGDYKGYLGGTAPFKFDRAVFDVIIRNFRAHPWYVAGGGADVVAYDFHHASEVDPADVAVEGAPAQAWARELEVRDGPNGCELWALTRFIEPMLSYRREGRYKSTSVCVWPESTDPVTGASIGWTLSSIAFTNDPFIQGMKPIAASRGFDPFCPPSTPQEVLDALRALFELGALATVDEVISALAKVRAYAAGTTPAPMGVKVDELVGDLRQIFNLPTLTAAPEVLAEADALLVALAEAPDVSTISAARKDSDLMDHYKTACIALSAKLKLKKLPETDELPAILCEAVDGAIESAGAGLKEADDQLRAVLGALGEQDVDGAMKRIADMFGQCAKLKAALPALEAYEAAMKESEEKAVEDDVQMAMSHYFAGTTSAKAALLHMRRNDAAGFAASYPRPTPEMLALTSKRVPLQASAGAKVSGVKVPMLPNGTAPTIELVNAQKGGNPNAKAVALVRASGGEKLSNEEATALGINIVRALGKTASAPASL